MRLGALYHVAYGYAVVKTLKNSNLSFFLLKSVGRLCLDDLWHDLVPMAGTANFAFTLGLAAPPVTLHVTYHVAAQLPLLKSLFT